MSAVLEAALGYASRGRVVFPVRPDDKVPYHKGWENFEVADEAQIRAWWREFPKAMIGIQTGPRSGFWALDIDVDPTKAIPVDGFPLLAQWEAEHGPLPDTCRVRSPRGGLHYYFRWTEGIRNSAGTEKNGRRGIDWRGEGGYVVAAPSMMTNGKSYRWEDPEGLFPLAPAPEWLLEKVMKPKLVDRAVEGQADDEDELGILSPGGASAKISDYLDATPRDYGKTALEAELADLRTTREPGRNHALNRAAFSLAQLVAGGVLSEGEVKSGLRAACRTNGLWESDGELKCEKTLKSGYDSGFAQPRTPKTRPKLRLHQGGAQPKTAPDPAGSLITEDSAAVKFAALYGDQLRYCHDTAAWFEWVGSHWRRNRTGLAFQYARELAREAAAQEADRSREKIEKTSFASGVERFAKSDPTFAVTIDRWDQDQFLLGTPGGTVDLRTGELREPDPADGITKVTAVAPAETADCPLWREFLDFASFGNAELVRFLQQWLGYGLTGDTREHALLFAFGGGGNGKGVFLNTTAGIMADYAKMAAMDTFTASAHEQHPTDLADLRGARMVVASETEEGRAWAEAKIKALTGGDTIKARFMRQDFFEYRPRFKLTIVGNHKPLLRNVDDAARRRFNLLPFTRKPEKPDLELEEKLKAEWPGILRWMIEGCLDWRKNGLIRPEVVKLATAAYFEDQDLVGQWLDDKCDVEPGNQHKWAFVAELFESWTTYSNAAGEKPGSVKSFSEGLARKGFEPHRTKTGRAFRGVRLNPMTDGDGWVTDRELNPSSLSGCSDERTTGGDGW